VYRNVVGPVVRQESMLFALGASVIYDIIKLSTLLQADPWCFFLYTLVLAPVLEKMIEDVLHGLKHLLNLDWRHGGNDLATQAIKSGRVRTGR